MRAFFCQCCHQLLFFENSVCLRCGTPVGYWPGAGSLVSLKPGSNLFRCANAEIAGCNWLVDSDGLLCRSCVLTRTRPHDADLSPTSAVAAAFIRAESAKRRLVFQLVELGLPVPDLTFDLLWSLDKPVRIGYEDGVITFDLAESDDAYRTRMRQELGEPYRTVLGHLRHEAGHHYWWTSVAPSPPHLAGWRALFGDEQIPYEAALERHYSSGPPAGWESNHVSAYATAHPWEDWAEAFAHYLHIRDTLQTAAAYGLAVIGPTLHPELIATPNPWPDDDVEEILSSWLPLTYALNAVNRSMGRSDLYPFVLSPVVVDKLAFVHEVVRSITGSIRTSRPLS
jgi:hypothetical protein